MAVKGMDWAQGLSVAPKYDEVAQLISEQFQAVFAALEASQWTGDDAERFLGEFQQLVSEADGVANEIRVLGEEFRGHAEGQRTASAQ